MSCCQTFSTINIRTDCIQELLTWTGGHRLIDMQSDQSQFLCTQMPISVVPTNQTGTSEFS